MHVELNFLLPFGLSPSSYVNFVYKENSQINKLVKSLCLLVLFSSIH